MADLFDCCVLLCVKMDVKSVALQLRKLASDPDNQVYIVNEKGCMKGLMGFLDNRDPEVICISLQALQFLSSHPLNKEPLSKVEGLLPKLVNLKDFDEENIKKQSHAILDNLQEFVNSSKKVSSIPTKAPQSTVSQKAIPGFTPTYLYNVPLQIKEKVTPLQMHVIERAVLVVKGVVSVTVNRNELTVYSRAQDKDIVQYLVAAVKGAGFTAIPGQGQDDPKASSTEELKNPRNSIGFVKPTTFIGSTIALASKENCSRFSNTSTASFGVSEYAPTTPSYLPTRARANTTGSDNTKAIMEYAGGYGKSSVQARVERQQQAVQEQAKSKSQVRSLFGAVTSYFW